ncbi:MAG: hypothetical protein CBB97_10650 [Candidatus Endolissoclinum sp. TMED37]|nr:MAG: hypothetical protein CBB97_10650 [Candidatus Endolissoclinum sp. TMED37]
MVTKYLNKKLNKKIINIKLLKTSFTARHRKSELIKWITNVLGLTNINFVAGIIIANLNKIRI